MRRLLLALTALALASFCIPMPVNAANQPGAVVQLPSVAKLASSDYSNTPQIQLTGYYAGSSNGGGNLVLASCTPDGALCFSDSAGHTFQRTDFGSKNIVDARQCGVKGVGLSNDDYTALNLCLQLASSLNIPTVSTGGGQVYDNTANITIPGNVTLDCGLGGVSVNYTGNDFTLASGFTHVIAMPAAYTIQPSSAGNSSLKNCQIERTGGPYAPATFVPVTLRDSLNEVAAFAGIAVTNGAPGFTVENVWAFGFGTCFASVKGNKKGEWSQGGGHCNYGMDLSNNGDALPIQRMSFGAFLTRQNGNASKNAWQIDNVINDGAGRYRAVVEIPTSDITILANDQFIFQGSLSKGTQSATGVWLAGSPSVTSLGTHGCLVTQCQEFTLLGGINGKTDSQDSQPSDGTALSLSATWTIGAQGNAVNIASGNTQNISVGQTVTQTGGCGAVPGGTTVKDVWPQQGIFFLTAALTCGSSGTLAFADTNFVFSTADKIAISAVHDNGDCIRYTNVSGLSGLNITCAGHQIGLHCADQSGNYRFANFSTQADADYYDPSIIGFLADGNHTGQDCGGGVITNGILTQIGTLGASINSDARSGSAPFTFVNTGMGPQSGGINGTIIDVESGSAIMDSDYALTQGNIFVSSGATYRNLFPATTDASINYQVGNILTGTDGGCSTQPQVTVTAIGVGGTIPYGGLAQTRAGVCSAWPTNFTAGSNLSCANGTGTGCGTGAVLTTDGLISADYTLSASNIDRGDLYIEDQNTSNIHVRGCGNTLMVFAIYSPLGPCIGGSSVSLGIVVDGTAQYIQCDAASGPKTITVNAGSTIPLFEFSVVKTDASSNLCTVTMSGSDTIGGVASAVLGVTKDGLKAKNVNGTPAWILVP